MSTYLLKPWPPLGSEAVNRQIDRLFDDVLSASGASDDHWIPDCNVHEDENGFYVEVALPGWEANEVTLEVEDKLLTVRGERSADDARQYYLQEIPDGSFSRVFTLPDSIDCDKARAYYANGLLHISFQKRKEAKAKRILIEAA